MKQLFDDGCLSPLWLTFECLSENDRQIDLRIFDGPFLNRVSSFVPDPWIP
jgi:hypothetical protein